MKKKISIMLSGLLLINKPIDAQVYKMNTKEYKNNYKIEGSVNNINQEINYQATKKAVSELKEDIYNIDNYNFFVISEDIKGIDGLYYHDSNNIYILNNEDISYLNTLNKEDYNYYYNIELLNSKSTIYHEVGHLLTVNNLTKKDIEDYKKIYNNHEFDNSSWENDIIENIAEDFNQYFFKKYNNIDIDQYTINNILDRDQEKLNNWLESIIDKHNQKIKDNEQLFNSLIKREAKQ